MERYNLDKKIPSCLVDKRLVTEIERYLKIRLVKKMTGILSLDGDCQPTYKLLIKDSLGEEYLGTIEEYHRDMFPNDITDLTVNYSINYSSVDIRIRFSKEYMFSDLNIDIKCEGAKEVSIGILNELNEIMKNNKTIHFLFYDKFAFLIYLMCLVCAGTWPWMKLPYFSQVWSFFFLLSVSYYAIRKISPYSTFATSKKEKIDKVISWFLNGMAGVFVFGVIGLYIRNLFL